MKQFPKTSQQINTDWLSTCLERTVLDFDLDQIGQGLGIMGTIHRIFPIYAPGETGPVSIILKSPINHDHTRFVARTFRLYEKEVAFYRSAATDSPLGTPKVFAASYDSEGDNFLLLLEDLADANVFNQIDGCPLPQAEIAVTSMAKHHAAFWESKRFSKDLSWLPSGWDPPFPQAVAQGVADSWNIFQRDFGDLVSPRIRKTAQDFPSNAASLMAFNTGPTTLAHGDFRLDNLFFRAENLFVIDWQICVRTSGAYDLGYFLSQSLTTVDRRSHEKNLLDLYQKELAETGIDYPVDDLWRDYRRSVLFCLCYPIQAGGGIELANERAVQLVAEMFGRVSSAIEDLDADQFMT